MEQSAVIKDKVFSAEEHRKIREQFPILSRQVYGKDLVYLDNAATTQKPDSVIDAIDSYYRNLNSNVHRGVHFLSQSATLAFELAREKVRAFINAKHTKEIIFTRGTTEGINLIASTFGRKFINKGDQILITAMEHHSNIVPWQMICEERSAELKIIPINEKGELILGDLDNLLNEKTKILSLAYVSNSLGTINPVKEIIAKAKAKGIRILLDAAQAAPHLRLDVQALDVDLLVFSGHKIYGPTGIGVLYGKEELLNELPPYMGGGEMISNVTFEKTTYNELPFKFEAGTPDISGAIGLGAAIDFIEEIGIEKIAAYEHELLNYAMSKLENYPDMRFVGTAAEKASVISFLAGKIHPYDAGTLLDQMGIAIRTGHHCTQPVMDQFKIPGTCRASFAVYNNFADIDRLWEGLLKVKQMMG